jgi:probable rRNA maturation factor
MLLLATGIPAGLRKKWLTALGAIIRRRFKVRRALSVAFVSRMEMQRLNQLYRNKGVATDVLSFQLDKRSATTRRYRHSRTSTKAQNTREETEDIMGEVILCLPVIRERARRTKKSVSRSVIELTIHGIMHILGFDHESDKDALRMERLEEQVMHELTKSLAK